MTFELSRMFKLIKKFKLGKTFKLSKIVNLMRHKNSVGHSNLLWHLNLIRCLKSVRYLKKFPRFYSLRRLLHNLVVFFVSEGCMHPLYTMRSCANNLLLLLLLLLLSYSYMYICSYHALSTFVSLEIHIKKRCTLCVIRDVSIELCEYLMVRASNIWNLLQPDENAMWMQRKCNANEMQM